MLANLVASYLLGLATPLTAVCVLPLYPGFIAFLSNHRRESDRRPPLLLGLAVVAGVTACMVAIGLVFSTLLELSLTGVAGIASRSRSRCWRSSACCCSPTSTSAACCRWCERPAPAAR